MVKPGQLSFGLLRGHDIHVGVDPDVASHAVSATDGAMGAGPELPQVGL